MEACVEAAALGLGVTQVLSAVALPTIRAGRLTPVLLDFASPGPPLYFAYPQNRRSSARLRAFGEFVRRAFAEVDEGWQGLLDSAGKG
jgi:LysR family transcriptional regulator for bpeEF and oprC